LSTHIPESFVAFGTAAVSRPENPAHTKISTAFISRQRRDTDFGFDLLNSFDESRPTNLVIDWPFV